MEGRRAGDPASLVANNELIRKSLNWVPQHDDLEKIVTDALNWEKKLQTSFSVVI